MEEGEDAKLAGFQKLTGGQRHTYADLISLTS